MKFGGLFWRIELRTVAALLTCAVLMAVVAAIVEFVDSSPRFNPGESAGDLFILTLMFGTLPALLYGAPVYTLAACKRWLSWPLVLLVGIAPGIALLFYERNIGFFFLACGACVAAFTHLYARATAHGGALSSPRTV
jgi:hypothetical protein